MSRRPYDYLVQIDAPSSDMLCACGFCDWRGPFVDVKPVEECCLTPGDPSPAGRCPDPECDALVYPVKQP